MANAVLDGSGKRGFLASDATNYGCAGRGSFDPFAKTEGRQIDPADKAFQVWKTCLHCAIEDETSIQAYDYDIHNDSCGKSIFFLCFFKFL